MDRLDAMTALVTVVDLEGFAPAARKLGLSASAVTRLIAKLEEHVGARLLQRTTRSVTLTDVGARYLESVRRILGDVAEAEASAQAERLQPAGRLVVSAPVMFGRMHVGPIMSAYLRQYPDVAAELRLADRMVNLVDEGIDVAVRIGHLADSSVVARAIGDMRRVVVGSSRYLKARGIPQTVADLATHDLIQLGTSPAPPREWRFHERGRTISVTPRSRYTTNSIEASILYAEQDGGLASVFAYQVADALKAGRLKVVLEAFEMPPVPIHIVYPSSRLLSAKVRAFIDLVVESADWHPREKPRAKAARRS